MSDRCRWYLQLRSTTVHVELGRKEYSRQEELGGFLSTVSRRWKFSRRSFYRGLCGHAEAVIACCRQPSPPDVTPAAPRDPEVPLPPGACWCPVLHPTSQTPASESALFAPCSAPDQNQKRRKNIIGKCETFISCSFCTGKLKSQEFLFFMFPI